MQRQGSRSDAGAAGRWFGHATKTLTPLDPDAAEEALADLVAANEEAGSAGLAKALAEPPLKAFLGAVLSLSPYLGGAFTRHPEWLGGLESGVEARLADILTTLAEPVADETESQFMGRLRRAKGEAHALIGLADLAGDGAQASVRRLSELADACVTAAAAFLLRDAHRAGKLVLPDPEKPEEGSGWVLLGMGKLGAHELNFSSDIDLIVLFDPHAPAVTDPLESTELFSRLTRRLVRIMQDRTGDGYVFRTDLRLRPDPGSTPLAIPIEAALNYYEARGQNWERAAMIKARQIAGDRKAGNFILKELRPYVWRKYMDFAAIADVHSIKRQIHAHRGHGEIAVRGHNVKLGRGGIREIEFFAQTQQLIAGGRFPDLRGRETVAMLRALADHRWVTEEASEALTERYWFLRDVEHRIQIVADEQSHILPEDDEGFSRVARLMGYDDDEAFAEDFRAALRVVESHYAALFETAPELSRGLGNLVFTGDVDDPDTLATLSELGFDRPADVIRIVRGWHFGRYRATASAEARERLTELTPALLEALSQTRRANDAIIRFDKFMSGLPAGIQLFSLLQNNPGLLRLLVTIMGAAPRLAETITRSPHVFDGLLDPTLLSELPNKAYLAERLGNFLEGATQYEESLDRLRIFASEQRFLIGVRLLTGAIDATRAGKAFSDLADLAISRALDAVIAEVAIRHGRVPGARVAILGMGKLGSRELTAGSDIDLILIYDHDESAEWSDGEKPLASSQYFARLTQRLIAAVSAPTAEGVLYELDLRLRPSGNKGPVATHMESFRKYQATDAWAWEHMALTRARAVAGDPALQEELEAEIATIIARPRDASEIRKAAREMRGLLAEEKPPRDDWDLKLIPGGLIDLEFIAQVATLTGSVEPDQWRWTSTAEILARLDTGFADQKTRDELLAAHMLYTTVMQVIRLCVADDFDKSDMPPGLVDILLRVTDLPDLSVLDAHLAETAARVRAHFERLVGKP